MRVFDPDDGQNRIRQPRRQMRRDQVRKGLGGEEGDMKTEEVGKEGRRESERHTRTHRQMRVEILVK